VHSVWKMKKLQVFIHRSSECTQLIINLKKIENLLNSSTFCSCFPHVCTPDFFLLLTCWAFRSFDLCIDYSIRRLFTTTKLVFHLDNQSALKLHEITTTTPSRSPNPSTIWKQSKPSEIKTKTHLIFVFVQNSSFLFTFIKIETKNYEKHNTCKCLEPLRGRSFLSPSFFGQLGKRFLFFRRKLNGFVGFSNHLTS
jgi:hypothetical protein